MNKSHLRCVGRCVVRRIKATISNDTGISFLLYVCWTVDSNKTNQAKQKKMWRRTRIFYSWIKSWSLKIGRHSFLPKNVCSTTDWSVFFFVHRQHHCMNPSLSHSFYPKYIALCMMRERFFWDILTITACYFSFGIFFRIEFFFRREIWIISTRKWRGGRGNHF